MGCGSSSAGNQLAQQQAQQQQFTNQAVGNINQAFSGFTPQFYNQQANNYMQWALPQVNNQFQQTSQQLGAKLANQGITNSSGAQNSWNQLNNTNQLAQQGVASTAQNQANQLRQQVAGEQANLIGQAQTANNPAAIGQQATAAAASYGAPSAFQPLGNLFGNFANLYLANNLANTYNPGLAALYGAGSGASNQQLGYY
jgi:hypothetical protein